MSIISTTANKVLEYFEVPFTSTLAISFVSYTDIELGMKLLVLATTLGYTIWKWYVERQEKSRKKKDKSKSNDK